MSAPWPAPGTEWPPPEIAEIREKLDDLASIVRPSASAQLDPEVRAWLARLLVVRSSGYLEQVVTLVSRAYVGRSSSGPVMNFAHFHLDPKRINNPRPDFLAEFVGRFDPALKEELGALLGAEDQRLRRALNRLVELRNAIAHGTNEDMVASQALVLSNVACEIGNWFILAFNPGRRHGTSSGSGVRGYTG